MWKSIAILILSLIFAQDLTMFISVVLIVAMYMMFQKTALKEVKMDKVFFVGDVHSRVELVTEALRIANGARVIFLGDIFDGPQGAVGVKKCLDLIRAAGAEMVLGNHELYPLFAKDKADLIRLWSLHYKVDTAMGDRIWEEWMELRSMLTEDDMEWLRSRPLWIKGTTNGRKWVAVHAKLPKGRLPSAWVKGSPTMEQIELVDNTEGETFWAENYKGGHGLAMIGHTRRSKLNGKCQWANVELLDWDAKKGAPGTAAIAEISANVNVKPLSPVGGKESVMALVNRVLGFIALAWALVACSPTVAVADSTNLPDIVKGLFIAGLCVGTGALIAKFKNNIVGKFASIIALTGKENPAMGIERLACTARLAVNVITAYFFARLGTTAIRQIFEIEGISRVIKTVVENRVISILEKGRRLAKKKNWTIVRHQRWLVKWGMAKKAKKAKMKKKKNSFVATNPSKMSREQRRRLAHQWRKEAGIKHVNKPSDKKEPMFIYSEGSKIPGGRKSSPPPFIHVATTIAARKRNNNGGKNVKTGPAFNTAARRQSALNRKRNTLTRPKDAVKVEVAQRKAKNKRAALPLLRTMVKPTVAKPAPVGAKVVVTKTTLATRIKETVCENTGKSAKASASLFLAPTAIEDAQKRTRRRELARQRRNATRANTPALAMVAGLGLATGMVAVAIIALAVIAILAVRKNRAEDVAMEEGPVEPQPLLLLLTELLDKPCPEPVETAPAPAPMPTAPEVVEAEPQPLLLRLIELLPAAQPEAAATCACGIPQEEGYVCDTCVRNEYAADMANALEDALEEPPFTDPGDWDGGAMDEEYAAGLLAGDQEAARRDAAELEEHLQVLAEEAAFDEMIENGLDGVELVEKQEGEQTPEQIWAGICRQLGVSTKNRSAIDAMNILIEMYQRKVDLYRFRHFGITRGYTRKQKDGSMKNGQTKTLRKDVIVRFASVLRQDKEMATWFAEASHDPSWEQFWPSIEALMKDKKQNWDAREWRTLRTRYEGAVQIVNDLCIEFLGKAKNNLNFRGGEVSCLASKDTFRYRVVDGAEAMAACKRINAVHRGGFCVARGVYQQQMQQGSHLPWVVDKLNGEGNWEEFGFVLTTTAGIADWGFGKHNRSNKSVELKTATEMLGGIVDLDHQKPERQFIEMFHKAWVSMRKPNLNDWKTFVREAAQKISPLTRSASFEVTEHEAKNGVIYSKAVTDYGTTAQTTYTFWNDGSETTCRVDSKLDATPKGFSLKFQRESKTIKKFFLRNSNYRPLKVLPWEIVPDEKELMGRYLTNSWRLTHAIEQAILRNAHHGVNYTHNELIMSIIREGFASWRELNVVAQEMSTVYHIKTRKPLTLSQLNKQNSILASLEGDYFVAETTLIPAPKPAPKSLPPIRSQYSINDDYYNSRNNPDTLIALFKRGYQWMESPSGYQLVSARKAAANPEKILKGEALATVLDAWIRATLKIQAQEGISSDSCENIADRFQMNFQSLLPGYVCSINAAEITSIGLRTVKSHVNKLPDSDSPEVLAIIGEYFKQLPGHEEKLKLDREAVAAAVSVSRAAQRAQLIAQGIDPDAEIPFCRAGAVLSVLALAAGLPAFAVVLPLAVTAVLAFIKMRNSDLESGETLTDDAGFCLYSGPFVGQGKNMEDNTQTAKEVKMGMIEKGNQVLKSILEKVTGGPGIPIVDWAGITGPKTYGRILESLNYEETALTLFHGGFRQMVIRDLTEEQIRALKGKFIWQDGDNTVIVRDSQQYEVPNACFRALMTSLTVAGQVPGSKKAVTLQEVNKYFGSLLWARAKAVQLQVNQILVMSKGVGDLYDGTVYVSESFANQSNWSLYAIRRILTAKGLVKGMIIVLPDSYFPDGISVLGSEIKPHLQLRRDKGKAITMQPQGDGHSGTARTLSMQLWAMIMGLFVGSKRFDAFAAESYENAKNGLDKATENLLAPAEDGEDGRDQLMAEAARQHGFNPLAAFRSYAKSLAEGLTKSFNPMKVNIAPFMGNGKALAPEGYPMMLPWMALCDAFKNAGQTAPKWMQEKLAAQLLVENRLFTRANGAIAILVRGLRFLDAAQVNGIRQLVIAAIATRIPTGKTSGIEVLLFDADEFAPELIPCLIGRKAKDVEFWLFPNELTLAFKVASEGGDDDDLYKFLTGTLHKIAIDGLQWRAETLTETPDSLDKEKKLRSFLAKFALNLRVDNVKLVELMKLPHTTKNLKGREVVGWPSLLGVKIVGGKARIVSQDVQEDVIHMTETSRDSIESQMDLFAKIMVANNDSPFSAAIGTVAQSHKFALGILAGHVVLPEHIRHIGRDWALFVVRTILLSDMVDACNKGKGYKKAAEALQELNYAWGWLCYSIAKVENAKVVCPRQYLISVPPMARDLFEERHAETYQEGEKTRKPGALLSKLFGYHEELGNAVEALSTAQHDRMEFAATVNVMAEAVSAPIGGAVSAEAFAAPIWRKVWAESGRRQEYLDGLEYLAARRAENPDDFLFQSAFMAELNDATVWAAHADFDEIAMKALVEANPDADPDSIMAQFKIAKLAMIYVNGFKGLHIPDNAIKITMSETGEFSANGGIPGYLLPTSGVSKSAMTTPGSWFIGGSEILIEWMMDPKVVAAVAARKAVDGDFNFVTFVMKSEAFGELANGKRPLLYTEDDFNGKSVMEILSMPGVYLASNTGDEAHEMQSGFLAAVADDVKKKRTDTLAAMKRPGLEMLEAIKRKDFKAIAELKVEGEAKRAAFAKLTFAELLEAFKIRTVANVEGTASVETIEVFNWTDAKRNAYAQFYNTFVVVKFGTSSDPDGNEIEIEVADTIDEAPAAVEATAVQPAVVVPVVAPVEKLDKAGLLGRLNRIHNVKEPAVVATPAVTPVYRIAFTGHRPEKIGGYDESSPMRVAVKQAIADALKRAIAKHGKSKEIIVVTGGALGVDTDAAREAYKLGLKFIVARPCSDHGGNFKADAKVAYEKMLKLAHEVVVVNNQPYDLAGKADCLHARNRWMVDNCDAVVAIWDGSPSGTSNCVAYAKKANRPMIIINPNDLMGNEPTPPTDPKPAPAPEVPAVKVERKDYPISGHTYCEIFQQDGKYSAELAQKFSTDEYVLVLRREPKNQHDNNAIALYAQRDKVGYVPKELAKTLAPMMDANPRRKYSFEAVVTGWDSGYPRFALEFTTVHQGRKGKEDGRKYQYWAADKNEAKDYGSFVDTAIVSLSTMISTKGNPAEWDRMKTKYQSISGYWFDLCDGDTESHNKFFAWVENQGLSGINFLGGEDNKYVITFGTKAILSRKSNAS